MKIAVQASTRGFALIIVMMVIVVFSVLAAGLAISMKVEMQLARNVDSESEMEWLGRSGVELARYVLALELAEQMKCPNEQYDALNQKWAGGPGGSCSTNGPLADISLDHVQLGRGKFSVKITDLERKVNINFANREIIQQALDSMSVEMFTASTILDSIEDWRDPNTSPHVNGADHIGGQARLAEDGLDDISRRNVHLSADINVEARLFRGCAAACFWRVRRFGVVAGFRRPGWPDDLFTRATLGRCSRENLRGCGSMNRFDRSMSATGNVHRLF